VVDTSITKKFEIIVKDEEVSEKKRYEKERLLINVKNVERKKNVVNEKYNEGYDDENDKIGKKVVDKDGNKIRLKVNDGEMGKEDKKKKY
jgi:hypothetical protein